MSSKKQRRILIGWKNNTYKLCGYYYLLDKKQEPYIKFIFPKSPNVYKKNINDKNISNQSNNNCNFYEFSYHHLSGIRHLKNSQDRIDQARNLPSITESSCIHLFTITIHYFKDYQVQKNIHPEDFLISKKFELKNSRSFDFCLFFKTQPKFKIEDCNLEVVDMYTFQLTEDLELGVSDVVLKKCWCPEISPLTSYHFFTYNNPICGVVSE